MMAIPTNRSKDRLGRFIIGDSVRLTIIGFTTFLIPLSFVGAPYPNELVLQHIPTVLAVVGLLAMTLCGSVTSLSFACMIAFLWIHTLGARWIYSFVPYDDWTRTLTGFTLSEQFGWQRNHYDRFVHFASGILGVPIASELLQRVAGMKPKGAAVMAISVVVSLGAAYEIFEWQLAVALSPQQAEAYNGQQGDVWDPQKDLALAGFGAAMSALYFYRWTLPAKLMSSYHVQRSVASLSSESDSSAKACNGPGVLNCLQRSRDLPD